MNFLKSHSGILKTSQRILDVIMLLAITWLIERWGGHKELMKILAIYGSFLLAAVFSLFRMYRSWRGSSIKKQIWFVFLSWISVLIIFNILFLLLSNKEQFAILWPYCLFKIPVFLLWALLIFLGLCSIRILTKSFLLFIREKGYNQRSAVIVGAGDAGRVLAKYLIETPTFGISLVGFFDDRLNKEDQIEITSNLKSRVLGSVNECPEVAIKNRFDMVFIALPLRAEEKINKLITVLGTKGVKVLLVPDLFTLGLQKASMYQIGGLYLLDFNLFPTWKRLFDILFSLFVTIISFPVWLIVVVLIKIEDGGPIFYRHPRVMENGRIFNCLKFRTMHVDADKRLRNILECNPDLQKEWEKSYKLKNDPRVTRIGKFLRKTSLDELPQFLNALAGQMSVVGARPIVFEELEKYYKSTALTYCATKPGITGPWQVGKRNDIENYDERVKLDRWYVLNSSFGLDLKIILRTILSVFHRKGAY